LFGGRYIRNSLLAIIAALFAFLIITDFIVYYHNKNTLYQEFSESKAEQLRLIVLATRDAIDKRDYVAAERLLDDWGKEVECIVTVEVANQDGSILASYDRGTPAKEAVTVKSTSESNGIGFVLMADTHEVMDNISGVLTKIVVISALIALMIVFIISVVLRRLAITPLNRQLSRRKNMLKKMARITKENKRLIESAGEGIFSLNIDGTCSFMNDSALAVLGYKHSEIIGKNIHKIIHHAGSDGEICAVTDCQIDFTLRTAKGVIVDEDTFWRKDGSSFPVTYSSFPLEEGNTQIGVVVVFRDITEQHKKRAVLEHQATHDPLTALVNRRELERRLERAGDTARNDNKEHILLYMDLDNFKRVNDTAGHHAGDGLLRTVAKKLSFVMRDRDTLARFGGDEFVVLLENCTMGAGLRIAGGIIEAICGHEFTWEGMSFVIGVSIGVVEVNSNCSDSDVILNAADSACYMAKQLGGCQIQVYSPEVLMGDKIH
jgi:diguanylate cyclase (GGDEF)-like protein/PAS domain S-box-containing protein